MFFCVDVRRKRWKLVRGEGGRLRASSWTLPGAFHNWSAPISHFSAAAARIEPLVINIDGTSQGSDQYIYDISLAGFLAAKCNYNS